MTNEALAIVIALCIGIVIGMVIASTVMSGKLAAQAQQLTEAHRLLAKASKNDHRDAKGRFVRAV